MIPPENGAFTVGSRHQRRFAAWLVYLHLCF